MQNKLCVNNESKNINKKKIVKKINKKKIVKKINKKSIKKKVTKKGKQTKYNLMTTKLIESQTTDDGKRRSSRIRDKKRNKTTKTTNKTNNTNKKRAKNKDKQNMNENNNNDSKSDDSSYIPALKKQKTTDSRKIIVQCEKRDKKSEIECEMIVQSKQNSEEEILVTQILSDHIFKGYPIQNKSHVISKTQLSYNVKDYNATDDYIVHKYFKHVTAVL